MSRADSFATAPVAFWCEPHNEFRLAGCNVTPGCLAQRNLAGNPFDKCKEYPLYTVPAPMAQGDKEKP